MKTVIVDVGEAKSNREISNEISSSIAGKPDAIILIGHGTNDGREFMGYSGADIIKLAYPSIIMLHACDCGKHLIDEIAGLGPTALGHISDIYVNIKDEVPQTALSVLTLLPKGARCSEILPSLRKAWFNQAKTLYDDGEFFRAALVNRLRFSLRCSERA